MAGAVPVSTSADDSPMGASPLGPVFDMQGGHAQLNANRQCLADTMAQYPSQLAMSSTPVHNLGVEAEMSMLGFSPDDSGHNDNVFGPYSFGAPNPNNSGYVMSNMTTQALPATSLRHNSSSASISPTDFTNPQNPFSNLSSDMLHNMLTYSGLDLSQISIPNQAAQLDGSQLNFYSPVDSRTNAAAQAAAASSGLNSLSAANFMSTIESLDSMDMENPAAIQGGGAASTLDALSGQHQLPNPYSAVPPGALSLSVSQPRQQRPISLHAQSLLQQDATGLGPTSSYPPTSAVAGPPHLTAMSTSDHHVGLTSLPTPYSPLEPTTSLAEALPSLKQRASSMQHASAAAPGEAPIDLVAPAVPPSNAVGSSGLPAQGLVTSSATALSLAGSTNPSSPTALSKKPVKNYYSTSGFDMIRALYYVSSRPNPEIDIGPVDLSCAFVVCDATLNDYPIIYVSDNFQHLTGYSSYEIIGQNCRFLQAPDGKVEAGSRREFTDNKAVYNLKQKLESGREVQQSLINYRKGGKPFLNLLTMIPIPWDDYKGGYKYFIGLQIDLVESPDAISGQSTHSVRIDYSHSNIPQYIWDPPTAAGEWGADNGRTLGKDDVSTLLQQFNASGGFGIGGTAVNAGASVGLGGGEGSGLVPSNLHSQSWDKMLLENVDDVVHVLSLKGVFLYLSPSCKAVLEYDAADLLGNSLSSICHPSDIVPVTREMRDTQAGQSINCVFRVRRKRSGYTWFESHGSLLVEQGKGRKCIVLVGRKRPAFALHRCDVDANGGIGDSELWMKLSTSGMVLHASPNMRSLLDLQPDSLIGTSMQDLMRKESRSGFNRSLEKVRRGIMASCHHEVQHRRGQVLQASTILYPGDAERGQKPTFVLAQTRLLKPASRNRESMASSSTTTTTTTATTASSVEELGGRAGAIGQVADPDTQTGGFLSSAGGGAVQLGSQDAALAADDNIFDELKTTRCTSWQYELRQMEKANRVLAEELGQLLANRKKRKRRKGVGNVPRDCANCHTRNTPEWRRGPSGQRDLCNSCGLRWAKQVGRVSPRNSARGAGSGVGAGSRNNGAGRTSGDASGKKSIDGGGSRDESGNGNGSGNNGNGHSHGQARHHQTAHGANGSGTAVTQEKTGSTEAYQVGGGGQDANGGLGGYGGHSTPRSSDPAATGGTGPSLALASEMEPIEEEREAA
ncbi:gata transcription factor [Grosmannia clavigera kw1407]|uniref:Gata transcription factor n=1 Tax=Grosmannia clavigera (strain kw1407 / UAMH 11150) TaxID=655863 RepID=F0XR87_GROCL|nr:gata transcription factor [Grosmannia clavigera kw1407]EFW99773.1 gata transcription factor [Grosmannia clavigera kw1407]